jgi:glycosyltransferase involved in cell wall biosynthesis
MYSLFYKRRKFKVNILSYEPQGGWILWDYAVRLNHELLKFGINSQINHSQLENFDITYHINYAGLSDVTVGGLHCTMITHIDEKWKFDVIIKHAAAGVYGICLSNDTARHMKNLSGYTTFCGIRLPAMIQPKHHTISVFLSSRCYSDGRKNEHWIEQFYTLFPQNLLNLSIMGAGWDDIVVKGVQNGYNISYYPDFIRDKYLDILSKADYMLYLGFDEGAVSVADAAAMGVKSIASAQGFHLELADDMVLYTDVQELIAIGKSIVNDVQIRNLRSNNAANWNQYAESHINLWSQLIKDR